MRPLKTANEKKTMRSPGIEPGPPAWQARILPLDQLRLMFLGKFVAKFVFALKKKAA